MCCCMKVSYSPECLQALKFAEKVEAVIKYSSREVRMITEAETTEQHITSCSYWCSTFNISDSVSPQ